MKWLSGGLLALLLLAGFVAYLRPDSVVELANLAGMCR